MSAEFDPVPTELNRVECLKAGSNLKDKVVIITGAGSGFGRSYARVAAKFGAKVVLSDLALGPVEALAKEIQAEGGIATAIQCDTTNWDQQVAMFKHGVATFGPIDVVFPNAGVGETGKWLEDAETADGDPAKPNFLTMNVNLIGASYTTKLAFYYLRRNPSKSKRFIVFIGSRYSTIAIPAGPMYTTAKHGILGVFKSSYAMAQADNINTNIICPWFTETDDVVSSVVKCSTDETFSGNTVFVDADGILAIPFEMPAASTSGYYAAVAKRGVYTTSYRRILKDIRLLSLQTFSFWFRSRRSKMFGVLSLILLILRVKRRAR